MEAEVYLMLNSIWMHNFVDVSYQNRLFSPLYGIIFTQSWDGIHILCGLYLLYSQDCKSELLQLLAFERIQHLCFWKRCTVCNDNIFCHMSLSNFVILLKVLEPPRKCNDGDHWRCELKDAATQHSRSAQVAVRCLFAITNMNWLHVKQFIPITSTPFYTFNPPPQLQFACK